MRSASGLRSAAGTFTTEAGRAAGAMIILDGATTNGDDGSDLAGGVTTTAAGTDRKQLNKLHALSGPTGSTKRASTTHHSADRHRFVNCRRSSHCSNRTHPTSTAACHERASSHSKTRSMPMVIFIFSPSL
jgi:hypothetical protein